jgi:hypothetical protein
MTTKPPALPTSKRDKIVYLLDHWDEIHDPDAGSPQGRPGDGTNTPHLAYMAHHPSVVELARCLAAVKLAAPFQHSHLMAYHQAEWRIHVRVGTVKRRGGKFERVEFRDRHRRIPEWVRMGYVRAGELRLEELFRGPVFIPDELWDALTLSSDEIEAKARRRRRIAA